MENEAEALVSLRLPDDLGGTMMEENVVSAAGASFCMPIERIETLIRDAGYEPRRRTTRYEILDPAPEAVS